MDVALTFGETLKDLRTEKRKRVEEVAADIGISKSVLSGYENDKTQPSYLTFKKLADYYSVSYDFLFGVARCQRRENIDISLRLGLSDEAIKNIERDRSYGYPGIVHGLDQFLRDRGFCDIFFENFTNFIDLDACKAVCDTLQDANYNTEYVEGAYIFFAGMQKALFTLRRKLIEERLGKLKNIREKEADRLDVELQKTYINQDDTKGDGDNG